MSDNTEFSRKNICSFLDMYLFEYLTQQFFLSYLGAFASSVSSLSLFRSFRCWYALKRRRVFDFWQNLGLLFKHNNDREPDVSFLSTCAYNFNTLRTGDADLRFYITTVQEGWRKSAFLTSACFPCTVQLIMQYIEPVSEWSWWRMFIET